MMKPSADIRKQPKLPPDFLTVSLLFFAELA
jgi:hypothetical protein